MKIILKIQVGTTYLDDDGNRKTFVSISKLSGKSLFLFLVLNFLKLLIIELFLFLKNDVTLLQTLMKSWRINDECFKIVYSLKFSNVSIRYSPQSAFYKVQFEPCLNKERDHNLKRASIFDINLNIQKNKLSLMRFDIIYD